MGSSECSEASEACALQASGGSGDLGEADDWEFVDDWQALELPIVLPTRRR
jgi:hypothetical protein